MEAKVVDEQEALRLIESSMGFEYRKLKAIFSKLGKENILDMFMERICSKIRKSDLESAQDRLEVIAEKNSQMTPERLAMPYELHDFVRIVRNYASHGKNLFKIGKNLGLSLFLGVVSYLSKDDNSDMGRFLYSINFGATLFFLGIALNYGLTEASIFYRQIKDKVFGKPLTERERELSDYVYFRKGE